MLKNIIRITVVGLTLSLCACASQILHGGKQDFDAGNYQDAMQKLMPLAQKNDASAEYAVGYMYYYGKGVSEDRKQGLDWINKAAEQGLPEAIRAQKAIANQDALNPLKRPQ